VHPRGYMVHRPHKVTAAKQQFMAGLAIAAEASAAVRRGCRMTVVQRAEWRGIILLACLLLLCSAEAC
jgi:hypothetical protein